MKDDALIAEWHKMIYTMMGGTDNSDTKNNTENIKKCLKWIEIQPKKIIPLPICMKIA